MVPTTLRQIGEVVNGKCIQGNLDTMVQGISVSNLETKPDDLFVAFVGEHNDGHRFVPDALARGAVAALVTKDLFLDNPNVALVRIDNPLKAVQALANFERRRFAGPVIGVTGSNGKTTTKDMLATVFSVSGECLATRGNQNTELGLPLTILRRTESHRSIVLEMGMRGKGQIAELCEIAMPTAGIITNIGHSHIELLGSQEGIADAKGELLESLPAGGIAALCFDDPWLRKLASRHPGQVVWYGLHEAPDAYATRIRTSPDGTYFTAHVQDAACDVFLPTFGQHNVRNALGALLLGVSHGLSLSAMSEALKDLPSSSGRLHVRRGTDDRTIIDDCYNASPLSTRASLEVLKEMAVDQPSVAILGDMFELGDYAEAGHREVGRYVAECEINYLLTVGDHSRWTAEEAAAAGCLQVRHFEDKGLLLADLNAAIPSRSTVLVKASRGMELEEVVNALAAAD